MSAWPTSEQFDQAHANGSTYAQNEIAGGAEEAQESPLDGQWAGAPTPRDVMNAVSYDDVLTGDGVMELCDAWERGYFDVWAHS